MPARATVLTKTVALVPHCHVHECNSYVCARCSRLSADHANRSVTRGVLLPAPPVHGDDPFGFQSM